MLPLFADLQELSVRAARGSRRGLLHQECRAVRVENEREDRNKDRDDERDDVETADADRVEDLPYDLEDRVDDQRANPAHVRDGVKARDHDARAECDAGHARRDSIPAVEWEESAADEAHS